MEQYTRSLILLITYVIEMLLKRLSLDPYSPFTNN